MARLLSELGTSRAGFHSDVAFLPLTQDPITGIKDG
jgi:hypothetical protein